MHRSKNCFTRYRRVLTAVLSLYPWLLILLTLLEAKDKPAGGFFSAGAAVALTLAGLSFINFIISIIFISLTHVFITTAEKGSVGYFCAINSISLMWMFFPAFDL